MDLTKTQATKVSPPSIFKRIGNAMGANVRSKVTVYNNTDATVYIILSDTPVHHIDGVAVEKVSVSRQLVGKYKDQCSFMAPGSQRRFNVFKQDIYYSVYFKLDDGTELVHTRDRLHNALKKDINVLQRHVSEAQRGKIPEHII